MTNRTLGMIPGLKPPEGVPETPKGFARLPTQAELLTTVKAWFAERPNFLGVSAVQEFDITPEERQELVEVYDKVIKQSVDEPEFEEKATKVFSTGRENYRAAIYTHATTGLKIGVSNDQHVLHGSCVEVPKPTSINVLKHVWVEAWYSGESSEYYVENVDDLRQLMRILNETECSDARLVGSEELLTAALFRA